MCADSSLAYAWWVFLESTNRALWYRSAVVTQSEEEMFEMNKISMLTKISRQLNFLNEDKRVQHLCQIYASQSSRPFPLQIFLSSWCDICKMFSIKEWILFFHYHRYDYIHFFHFSLIFSKRLDLLIHLRIFWLYNPVSTRTNRTYCFFFKYKHNMNDDPIRAFVWHQFMETVRSIL